MALADLKNNWDLVIIGGGVTGAGIFHEIARMGLQVLLVEQNDFAWGTSSRSSKLIHGGLRYLKEGHFLLTREAVKARERLLKEAPGLVNPLVFLVPVYKDRGPKRWMLEAGLSVYNLIAKKQRHQFLHPDEFIKQVLLIDRKGLVGGFRFYDAQVDDARLVLRLIFEGIHAGGCAVNYTGAQRIERDEQGGVTGIMLIDTETRDTRRITARAIVNATGCWVEQLHPLPKTTYHLRPLRGSHLIFPAHALPIRTAISFIHPEDGRALFAIPWQGAVIVGTTDLDHREDLALEPTITAKEIDYLIAGVNIVFPSLNISSRQCLSVMAGIRPIISQANREPSSESREHFVWKDKGLVTITGGKLTTYRKLAIDTLKAAKTYVPEIRVPNAGSPGFSAPIIEPSPVKTLSADTWRTLCGRYGDNAFKIVESASPENLTLIPGTYTFWAELPYVAANEQVRHLTDLLLRRVRIGLLCPHGGKRYLRRIRNLCQPVLPWDRRRWREEIRTYKVLWRKVHGLPGARMGIDERFQAFFNRINRREKTGPATKVNDTEID